MLEQKVGSGGLLGRPLGGLHRYGCVYAYHVFAGGDAISGQQCPLHVRAGLCHNDLPFGVHVPHHPTASHVHELL